MEELVNLPAESAQQEGKAAPGLSWEKWHKPDAIERTQKKVLHMMRYFHEGDFLFKIGIFAGFRNRCRSCDHAVRYVCGSYDGNCRYACLHRIFPFGYSCFFSNAVA